ncbi:MAG TPA: penicillin acylase family protein [Candidatus Kryptonia bacterium]
MKRFKLVLAIASLTLIIILVSILLLLRKIGTSSLPQEKGHIALAGIGSNVVVYRDSVGVPYIEARSDSDAYFALGFVHAQDRLFQMEVYRRLGEGRLSEIFGERTLDIDLLFRTLRFTELADSLYQTVSPISRDLLNWYCRGVNAYIETTKALPAEFTMLEFHPREWTPRDCLIVARLMAWDLNLAWWTKPVFGEIYNKLGPDKASVLIPLFSDRQNLKLPQRNRKGTYTSLERFIEINSEAYSFLEGSKSPDGIGSNNWVISPTRTGMGYPILCNDPHLAFSLPARWYLVSIASPTVHVIGVSIPGAPGIVIGRNDRIAWGMTNVMADDADFYEVQPDSANPDSFQYDGKLLAFANKVDTIEIKDKPAYVFIKREAEQGPVVSDVLSNSYKMSSLHSQSSEDSGIVALRWSAYWPSDEIRAIYLLNTANNYEEFLAALKNFGAPAQNFVFADVNGNIGFKAAGNIPLRKYPLPFLPQAGNNSKLVWESFIPFELLPQNLNPAGGFYATANNKTIPENFPYYLTNLYEASSRIDRINSFIASHDTMNLGLSKTLQLDYYSEYMVELSRKILAACDSENFSPKELVYLRNFDGNIIAKSTAASILNATFVELIRDVFEPELGTSLYRKYVLIGNVPTRMLDAYINDPRLVGKLYGADNGDSLLNFKTAESFNNALQSLRQRFGADPINWTWGRLHTLELKHPLSSNSVIKRLYDLGPYERGGNSTTLNNGEFSLDDPYEMTIGPSMRMIVDLGRQGAYFSLPGGECGQLLSLHYSDLMNDYLRGDVRFFPTRIPLGEEMNRLELIPLQ